MLVNASVSIDGEILGGLRLDLKRKTEIGDLVKRVSRDVVGEGFRRIMLIEDFTRSVFSSDTGSILRVSERAQVDGVLEWFGRFYMTFLFQRRKIVFTFGEEAEGDLGNLEEIFLGSGGYMGYEITPVPHEKAMDLSKGKKLKDIVEIRPVGSVEVDGEVLDPDTRLGDIVEGVMEIRTFYRKRPMCTMTFPSPAFEPISSGIELVELCSLGDSFEVETFSGSVSGVCSG